MLHSLVTSPKTLSYYFKATDLVIWAACRHETSWLGILHDEGLIGRFVKFYSGRLRVSQFVAWLVRCRRCYDLLDGSGWGRESVRLYFVGPDRCSGFDAMDINLFVVCRRQLQLMILSILNLAMSLLSPTQKDTQINYSKQKRPALTYCLGDPIIFGLYGFGLYCSWHGSNFFCSVISSIMVFLGA